MVEINEKFEALTTEQSLAGSGRVRRMVSNLTNQINNINRNNELKQKIIRKKHIKSQTTDEMKSYHLQETIDGIQIQIKQPHLISVVVKNNDLTNNEFNKQENFKTSIRIYPLKLGRTTIGSSETNDIVLHGEGILDEHCFIENSNLVLSNMNNNNNNNLVTFYPIGELCSIDGVLIDQPFRLQSG